MGHENRMTESYTLTTIFAVPSFQDIWMSHLFNASGKEGFYWAKECLCAYVTVTLEILLNIASLSSIVPRSDLATVIHVCISSHMDYSN